MKEEEIRPAKIFEEYLRLAKEDTYIYFGETEKHEGNCPACDNKGIPAFEKYGFVYEHCQNCYTLFVNPRPDAETFSKYYTESSSSRYWASTFYKETAEMRRAKLWKPKARLILDTLERYNVAHHRIVDIGGGFGLFAEEMRLLSGETPVVIEPGPHLAEVCREKELPVVQKFLEQVKLTDLSYEPKVFVSFELFEHLHNPTDFLEKLKHLMNSGDLFIFTTLSGKGVDIQVLWENSKSVTPPHHLNFFNPQSVSILLSRLGFETLEITTPGKLDIDILSNNQDKIKDRFWKTFVAMASDTEKEQWQKTISKSGWSSHMMAVCRKP